MCLFSKQHLHNASRPYFPTNTFEDSLNDLFVFLADTSCAGDDFRCSSGKCIPRDRVCDLNPDCPLLDDEDKEFCSMRHYWFISSVSSLNKQKVLDFNTSEWEGGCFLFLKCIFFSFELKLYFWKVFINYFYLRCCDIFFIINKHCKSMITA